MKENVLTAKRKSRELLAKLQLPATKMHLEQTKEKQEDTFLQSHFGGQPYFEFGEKWPRSVSGNELDFIFQVFSGEGRCLPKGIALVQFYYDWTTRPWFNENEGWLVKIYNKADTEHYVPVESGLSEPEWYCPIVFEQVCTLPDWESVDLYNNQISDLAYEINSESPWEAYRELVHECVPKQRFQSQLGGYPIFVQGNETPISKNGKPMELLFQIDSEENADLRWADMGMVYVFYDRIDGNVYFSLQSL